MIQKVCINTSLRKVYLMNRSVKVQLGDVESEKKKVVLDRCRMSRVALRKGILDESF